MKALQQFLRPEFLNRVDEVICFNQLTRGELPGPLPHIMLEELQDVLKEKDLDLHLGRGRAGPAGEGLLLRCLRRAEPAAARFRRTLEDPIATKIIDSYLSPIHALKAVVEDGKILITAL